MVHITWEEAHQAESERDQVRQARCRPIPPTRMQVITAYVFRDLRKLKTSALYLWDLWLSLYKAANFQILANKYETEAGTQRPNLGDRVVGLENEHPEIYFKRGPTKSAITVFAGIVLLLGIATVSYLSHLAVNRGAIAQQGPHNTSNLKGTVEGSQPQPVTPQLSSTSHESVQPDGTAERAQGHLENFKVVDNSFVRDKPQPNATIIATLQPGTRVTVESKTDGYLRIHSLSDADIIGYVHEQDAFFQSIK